MSVLSYYVVDQLMALLPFKAAGPDERRFCCPFCGEQDYKFYVNPEREKFICFKCETRSGYKNFISLYAEVKGLEYRVARDALKIYIEREVPDDVDGSLEWLLGDDRPSDLEEVIPSIELPTGVFSYAEKPNEPVFQYCFDRGLTKDDLLSLNVHGVGDYDLLVYKDTRVAGNLRNRVIFPIYHIATRELVAWLGRATFTVTEFVPKYVNSPGSPFSKIVAPSVIQKNSDIVICEGYLDAIAIRRAGIPAYCAFGKKLSDDQVKLLTSLDPKSVTVWYDQGAEGSAEGVARRLEKTFGARYVYLVDPSTLPEGRDTGDTLGMPDGVSLVKSAFEGRFTIGSSKFLEFKMTQALNAV